MLVWQRQALASINAKNIKARIKGEKANELGKAGSFQGCEDGPGTTSGVRASGAKQARIAGE